MPGPLITEATGEDLDEVVALVNSAYRGESARAGWTNEAGLVAGQRTSRAMLEDEVAAPDPSRILLLRDEAGGPLRGCVMMQLFRDDAERRLCHLAMLTVAPDAQARGRGRQLIAEVERRAREHGCAAVEMTVVRQRDELIAYYERRGYVRTGRVKPFPYDDGRFGQPLRDDLAFVVLSKPLSES